MEQDIYLDVYFSFNFLMDFFVLFLTGIIIKNNKKIYRTIVSAIIGATYATIVMITEGMEIYQKSIGIFQKGIGEDLTKPLKIVLTYVVIVYVMELIAYGKYKSQKKDESGEAKKEAYPESVSDCRRGTGWNSDSCDTCFYRIYLETGDGSCEVSGRYGRDPSGICSPAVYHAGGYPRKSYCQ